MLKFLIAYVLIGIAIVVFTGIREAREGYEEDERESFPNMFKNAIVIIVLWLPIFIKSKRM